MWNLFTGPAVGLLSFGVLLGAACAGLMLAARGGEAGRHGSAARIIRGGATLSAVFGVLTLALMISTLKSSFDSATRDVRRLGSELVDVDRGLRRFGPAGDAQREVLFRYATRLMRDIWPLSHPRLRPDSASGRDPLLRLQRGVDGMTAGPPGARADVQEGLHQAELLHADLMSRRGGSLSGWLIGLLLFWLTLGFAGIGLMAPRTPFALTAVVLFALAVSGAMFLASEYDYPFDGLIVVSTAPIEDALFAITE